MENETERPKPEREKVIDGWTQKVGKIRDELEGISESSSINEQDYDTSIFGKVKLGSVLDHVKYRLENFTEVDFPQEEVEQGDILDELDREALTLLSIGIFFNQLSESKQESFSIKEKAIQTAKDSFGLEVNPEEKMEHPLCWDYAKISKKIAEKFGLDIHIVTYTVHKNVKVEDRGYIFDYPLSKSTMGLVVGGEEEYETLRGNDREVAFWDAVRSIIN